MKTRDVITRLLLAGYDVKLPHKDFYDTPDLHVYAPRGMVRELVAWIDSFGVGVSVDILTYSGPWYIVGRGKVDVCRVLEVISNQHPINKGEQ